MRHYNRIIRRLPGIKPSLQGYRSLFAPLTLSDSECIELLCPQLQKLPQKRDYFENLAQIGPSLLEIYLNDYLGTQTAQISNDLLDQYVSTNNIYELLLVTPDQKVEIARKEARLLVQNTLAAVHLQLGPFAASQIAKKVCGGASGLANTYIYSW